MKQKWSLDVANLRKIQLEGTRSAALQQEVFYHACRQINQLCGYKQDYKLPFVSSLRKCLSPLSVEWILCVNLLLWQRFRDFKTVTSFHENPSVLTIRRKDDSILFVSASVPVRMPSKFPQNQGWRRWGGGVTLLHKLCRNVSPPKCIVFKPLGSGIGWYVSLFRPGIGLGF